MRQWSHGTSISLRAWVVSLGVHLVLLGMFAVVRLHSEAPQAGVESAAFVSLEQVSHVIQTEPITPKPKLRPIAFERPRMDLLSESKRPAVVEVLPDDSQPILSEELIRPAVNFFGDRSAAKRICFVTDCSGSMFGRMGLVRGQLRQAVEKLAPDQFFSILFFQDGGAVLENGSGALERAAASSKQKALELIDTVRPSGPTEPLGALRKAMTLRTPGGQGADLIYFLTDGFDLEEANAVHFIRHVEKMRKELAPGVVIHTIGFRPEREDLWILKAIASESGGRFIPVETGEEKVE